MLLTKFNTEKTKPYWRVQRSKEQTRNVIFLSRCRSRCRPCCLRSLFTYPRRMESWFSLGRKVVAQIFKSGEPGGDRTGDLVVERQRSYQLCELCLPDVLRWITCKHNECTLKRTKVTKVTACLPPSSLVPRVKLTSEYL